MSKVELDEPAFKESWGQGLVILHNPNALIPLQKDYFPGAAQIYFQEGSIFSDVPNFHPFSSITQSFLETYIPIDFPNTHISSLFKNQYEKFTTDKKPEADFLFNEKQWFTDPNSNVIGTVAMDRYDRDWNYVVFGKRSDGTYRSIDFGSKFYITRQEATADLVAKMESIYLSGQALFD